jgi:alpha-D-ribose 1-methylphosphonate 5-triphosphate diphosphatase
MTTDFSLTNVRAVLDDRIADDVTVVVADGILAAVDERVPAPVGAIDGCGLLLLPGLVDSHSDGLEKEIRPRRTADFPLGYAIESFEGRLRAAGVTTVFHGLGYQEKEQVDRSVDGARAVGEALAERRRSPAAAVEHAALYRFEARDPVSLTPLLDDLGRNRLLGVGTPLISFEDHTPGQGQFRDVTQFEAAIDPASLPVGVSVTDHVRRMVDEAETLVDVRDRNLERLTPLARRGEIRMLAHDPVTIDDIERAQQAGAAIAEFPVTEEAARAARERGLITVMGAPNALRGRSHSGNASARALVAAGLCDVIASDYLPSAMLASAFAMAREACCSLPNAVGLITSGPARLAGLDDRGRLAVGLRADLVLVDDRGRWPAVVGLRRAAEHREWRVFG